MCGTPFKVRKQSTSQARHWEQHACGERWQERDFLFVFQGSPFGSALKTNALPKRVILAKGHCSGILFRFLFQILSSASFLPLLPSALEKSIHTRLSLSFSHNTHTHPIYIFCPDWSLQHQNTIYVYTCYTDSIRPRPRFRLTLPWLAGVLVISKERPQLLFAKKKRETTHLYAYKEIKSTTNNGRLQP